MDHKPAPEAAEDESSSNKTQIIWAVIFALIVVVLIGAMQAIDYYGDPANTSAPRDAADH